MDDPNLGAMAFWAIFTLLAIVYAIVHDIWRRK